MLFGPCMMHFDVEWGCRVERTSEPRKQDSRMKLGLIVFKHKQIGVFGVCMMHFDIKWIS